MCSKLAANNGIILQTLREPSNGEIQTLKESGEWRFVPGTQNPADWATGSTLSGDLMISPDWIEGPKFFKLENRNGLKTYLG